MDEGMDDDVERELLDLPGLARELSESSGPSVRPRSSAGSPCDDVDDKAAVNSSAEPAENQDFRRVAVEDACSFTVSSASIEVEATTGVGAGISTVDLDDGCGVASGGLVV